MQLLSDFMPNNDISHAERNQCCSPIVIRPSMTTWGPILVPAAVSSGKTEDGNKKVVTTKTIILILLNLTIDSPIKIFLKIT